MAPWLEDKTGHVIFRLSAKHYFYVCSARKPSAFPFAVPIVLHISPAIIIIFSRTKAELLEFVLCVSRLIASEFMNILKLHLAQHQSQERSHLSHVLLQPTARFPERGKSGGIRPPLFHFIYC